MRASLFTCLIFTSPFLFGQKQPYAFHKRLSTWENPPNSYDMQMISFSPDEKYLAAGTPEGTFRIWNVETGEVHMNLTDSGKSIYTYKTQFSPDGKLLVSVGTFYPHKGIKIWDAKNFKLLKIITCDTIRAYSKHKDNSVFPRTFLSMDFTPDSKFMITGDGDGIISVWETGAWELRSLINTKLDIWDLKITNNGKLLATAAKEGKVKFWYIKNGNLQLKDSIQSCDINHQITSIAISPDDKYFSTNTADSLKIINLETGLTEKTLMTSPEEFFVISVDFSPDGKYFVSGHTANNLKIWSAKTYQEVAELQGNIHNGDQNETEHGFVKASFSPQSTYLALSNQAGFIYLYKLTKR